MRTYELLVRGRTVVPNSPDMRIVRTSVGVDQVHVLFDSDEWSAFPITVTFAQGSDVVSRTLVTSETGGDELVMEGTVIIPWEVTDEVGPIRVTLHGTDHDGRHIVTARSAPLVVVESGDAEVGEGDEPSQGQWSQAYADTVELLSEVRQALERLSGVVTFDDVAGASLGVSKPDGTTITIDDDGTLHGCPGYELPVSSDGVLGGVMPDGETTTVDDDGTIHAATYTLVKATKHRLGGVKVDGTTIAVSADGTISCVPFDLPEATSSSLGGVIIGEGLNIDGGVASVDYFTKAQIEALTPIDGVANADEVDF